MPRWWDVEPGCFPARKICCCWISSGTANGTNFAGRRIWYAIIPDPFQRRVSEIMAEESQGEAVDLLSAEGKGRIISQRKNEKACEAGGATPPQAGPGGPAAV